jgi:hypothetical protein
MSMSGSYLTLLFCLFYILNLQGRGRWSTYYTKPTALYILCTHYTIIDSSKLKLPVSVSARTKQTARELE